MTPHNQTTEYSINRVLKIYPNITTSDLLQKPFNLKSVLSYVYIILVAGWLDCLLSICFPQLFLWKEARIIKVLIRDNVIHQPKTISHSLTHLGKKISEHSQVLPAAMPSPSWVFSLQSCLISFYSLSFFLFTIFVWIGQVFAHLRIFAPSGSPIWITLSIELLKAYCFTSHRSLTTYHSQWGLPCPFYLNHRSPHSVPFFYFIVFITTLHYGIYLFGCLPSLFLHREGF